MRRTHFEAFAPICPVCLRAGRGRHNLILAHEMRAGAEDVQDGILHCSLQACRHEYPIIDGLPVIVPDLRRLMTDRGVEILMRTDLDPSLESLVGDAIGPDSWFDAIRQMLSTYGWDAFAAHDPMEIASEHGPDPGAAQRCLARLRELAGEHSSVSRVIDAGCGAGGTSFALAAHNPEALVLGLDTNVALLRLARSALAGEVSYPRRRIGLVYDRRRFPVDLPGAAGSISGL